MVSLWGGDLGPRYHFFGLASAETLQFPPGLQLSIKAAPGLYLISTEGLWVQLSQLRPSSTEGQGGNSGALAPRWTMVRPGGCVGPHVPQITAQAATSLLIGFFPRMLLRAGGSRHLCSQISPGWTGSALTSRWVTGWEHAPIPHQSTTYTHSWLPLSFSPPLIQILGSQSQSRGKMPSPHSPGVSPKLLFMP